MDRTIRVTGKARISVKPDVVRLIITQTDIREAYEDAVKESADAKKVLTDALKTIGFDKKDLKTTFFNIDAEYEGYQAKDKSWKQRLMGYRFRHSMKLEFPVAGDKLGSVLFVISQCAGEPEISIEYTVSDPEGPKNELLAKAVKDSQKKAEVLSKAAGVSLGEIKTIDYSWAELNIISSPMREAKLAKSCNDSVMECRSIDLDIEADDINVTDTVTVVWEIA